MNAVSLTHSDRPAWVVQIRTVNAAGQGLDLIISHHLPEPDRTQARHQFNRRVESLRSLGHVLWEQTAESDSLVIHTFALPSTGAIRQVWLYRNACTICGGVPSPHAAEEGRAVVCSSRACKPRQS